MKWGGEEGAAVLAGNMGVWGGGNRDQFALVGWSQVMGSCKCQDGADVFDVAGMRRAGKKVVGLAMLERGQCPSWLVGPESAVGSQEVGRWQRMGEEGSQMTHVHVEVLQKSTGVWGLCDDWELVPI